MLLFVIMLGRFCFANGLAWLDPLPDGPNYTYHNDTLMNYSATDHFIGRPFVKRFALCYRSIVCLSVLSVTFVHCGQTVRRIKMKLGMQVGLGLGHIVLVGNSAPPSPKGHSPQFSAHIWCGQMAAWIKMSLGMDLVLGPGDSVLEGDPAPLPKRGYWK